MDTNPRIKVYYTNPLGQRIHFDTTQMFDNLKDAEIFMTEFYGVICHCEFETIKEVMPC